MTCNSYKLIFGQSILDFAFIQSKTCSGQVRFNQHEFTFNAHHQKLNIPIHVKGTFSGHLWSTIMLSTILIEAITRNHNK